MLSFRCYLELWVQIFRCDRSAPETHESGKFFGHAGSGGGILSIPRYQQWLHKSYPVFLKVSQMRFCEYSCRVTGCCSTSDSWWSEIYFLRLNISSSSLWEGVPPELSPKRDKPQIRAFQEQTGNLWKYEHTTPNSTKMRANLVHKRPDFFSRLQAMRMVTTSLRTESY